MVPVVKQKGMVVVLTAQLQATLANSHGQHCLLDILGAFPHAAFSELEMDITRWLAQKLGVSGLPSIRVVKSHRNKVLNLAGSQPRLIKSTIGNFYCKTNLGRILAHVRTP